jgi:hypothetical protein
MKSNQGWQLHVNLVHPSWGLSSYSYCIYQPPHSLNVQKMCWFKQRQKRTYTVLTLWVWTLSYWQVFFRWRAKKWHHMASQNMIYNSCLSLCRCSEKWQALVWSLYRFPSTALCSSTQWAFIHDTCMSIPFTTHSLDPCSTI